MIGSEWGLKMQSEIYQSKHMLKFFTTCVEDRGISANVEKLKIDSYGPLNYVSMIFLCFFNNISLSFFFQC